MWTLLKAIIGTVLGSFWDRLFPPKTAVDQKVDDLAASVQEAQHAKQIASEVDRESLESVMSDLDKRVRKPDP